MITKRTVMVREIIKELLDRPLDEKISFFEGGKVDDETALAIVDEMVLNLIQHRGGFKEAKSSARGRKLLARREMLREMLEEGRCPHVSYT